MIRGLLLMVLAASAAGAQTGWVRVDAAAGTVMVDGVVAGPAGEWVEAAPGARQIALVDDVAAWNPRRVETQVRVASGDSLRVPLVLPLRTRIESLPIRAQVARRSPDGRLDSLGIAPLTLDLPPGERLELVATLEGYQPARTVAVAGQPTVIVLAPADGRVAEATLLPTERSTARRTLVDAAIGAATLAAGALAIHYKFRADAVDDRYRALASPERGDEGLRQEALRLDRISAGALIGMQAGVAVLALRLVRR